MATVILDSIRDVSCSEVAGVIAEATRTAIVIEEDADSWGSGASRMQDILNLDDLPAPGSVFDADHTSLYATGRTLRMESPGRAEVVISYRFYPSSLNNNFHLDRPNTGMAQITTQKDRDGSPLKVTHDQVAQGGEITVMQPEDGFDRDIVLSVPPGSHQQITRDWQGYINSGTWFDSEPGTWLCQQALPEPLDTRATEPTWKYIYHFSFAYEPTGWNPDIFWRDPGSGRPPSGLVDGTGFKEISWYDQRDFNIDPVVIEETEAE